MSKQANVGGLNRRAILMGGSSAIALGTAIADAHGQALQLAQAAGQPQPSAPSGRKPNILIIWGDDIGEFNISAYNHGHDGLQDAQHRPHRQGRRAVHRLVRPAELHRRPRRVHHRAVAHPHRPHQGRPAGRARRACRRKTRRSPICSSRSATRPASSARTTSATATSSCRRSTASTSSSATSTT